MRNNLSVIYLFINHDNKPLNILRFMNLFNIVVESSSFIKLYEMNPFVRFDIYIYIYIYIYNNHCRLVFYM